MSVSYAERPPYRSVSVLDAMEKRRSLTRRQMCAGRRLAASYALGVAGMRGDGQVLTHPPSTYVEARIAAAKDYERARDAIGGRLWPIVWAVCCADMSVSEIAHQRNVNPTAAMALLKVALDIAADCYGLPEGT